MKKRAYRMTRRAEAEERTRLRITESAMALHGSLGPSRTSISSIAEHAGVRRSTVYRHFPDETSLFNACTNHWFAMHPLPELGRWATMKDADQRLRIGLRELYSWYRKTERMMLNVLRDEEMPAVREKVAGYRFYLEEARKVLLQGRPGRKAALQRMVPALGHALAFSTWRSLADEQGQDDDACAELMARFVLFCSSGNRR
ncbi:MAG TPA: TetR family transcriptional regulator [Acidobacteriaceae bacterium]|nr:TetR family transcriptional regulator [Acidobacteriaceae bacterium]